MTFVKNARAVPFVSRLLLSLKMGTAQNSFAVDKKNLNGKINYLFFHAS